MPLRKASSHNTACGSLSPSSVTQKMGGNTQSGARRLKVSGRAHVAWGSSAGILSAGLAEVSAQGTEALGQSMVSSLLFLSGRTPGSWLQAEAAGQSSDDIKSRNSQVTPPPVTKSLEVSIAGALNLWGHDPFGIAYQRYHIFTLKFIRAAKLLL